jgi:predicted metalloprotease with PDZ domain
LPQAGDRGLDATPTWGRTYWGGALYCLLADLEIRQRTKNRYGLRDALVAIVEAGGNIEVDWSIQRALRIGDRATGVPVLSELYEKMKDQPSPVDLDELWRRLGVSVRNRQVHFDDTAPLADVRKAMTPS